ncbi:microcompartment protein PduM [Pilibacter termitis]|uniref:Microcompartment protein PduM n=1 Tax=Pilibacter termitis TaxID=263852 RepID=A0A1T4MJM1_9ENTE|nr:PduM family microcompartment protein [Pilibacter termitis]SJZ67290.1 microcompartment protein PduM [Pilibacter termitis]
MEEIIQKIIQLLFQREQSTLVVSAKDDFFQSKIGVRDFLKHQHITITDVGVLFLKEIAEKRETSFVSWIFESLEYGCEVTLELAFSQVSFIPRDFLVCSPFILQHKNGLKCYALSKKILTYQDVFWLDCSFVLILEENQQLTALAREYLEKEKITVEKIRKAKRGV